jgi:hypothetical protein
MTRQHDPRWKPTRAEIRRAEREAFRGDWMYLAGMAAFLAILSIVRMFK